MPFYKVPSAPAVSRQSAGVAPPTHLVSTADVMTASDVTNRSSDMYFGDGNESFSDLTEVDRDSELMRRTYGHGFEKEDRGLSKKTDNNSTSDTRRQKVRSEIEREMALQSRRDQELAAMRQSFSPSGSTCSIDSVATGSSAESNNGPATSVTGSDDEHRRYAHPGESLIVRELLEQKQRELELRGRWKEMGFDVPDSNSDGETPFTIPQPISDKSSSQMSIASTSSSTDKFPLEHHHQQLSESERYERDSVASSVDKSGFMKKVQPFEDPDTVIDGRVPYIPADETPIEREIRLVKERELALRIERGLTLSPDQPDQGSERRGSVQIELPEQSLSEFSKDRYLDPQTKGTMKKLANSRLQMEISKETQRELDLKSQGMIHTTSQERKGEQAKYVELISKQNGSPVVANGGFKARNSVTSLASNNHATAPSACVTSPTTNESLASQPMTQQAPVHCNKVELLNQTNTELLEKFAQNSNKDSTGTLQLKAKPAGTRLSAAELRMQKELRDLQNREEELRSRQQCISNDDPTSFVSNGNHTADNDVTDLSRDEYEESMTSRPRNRSALIEQWESRIDS